MNYYDELSIVSKKKTEWKGDQKTLMKKTESHEAVFFFFGKFSRSSFVQTLTENKNFPKSQTKDGCFYQEKNLQLKSREITIENEFTR